jgi:hypothetical protein
VKRRLHAKLGQLFGHHYELVGMTADHGMPLFRSQYGSEWWPDPKHCPTVLTRRDTFERYN